MSEEAIKTDDKPILQGEGGLFLPGTAPGPGRPKGSISLKTILQQELDKLPPGETMSYALAMVKRQLKQAIIDGDAATQRLIWSYIEGMPMQKTELSGANGQPLVISFDKAFDSGITLSPTQDSPVAR